MWFQNGKHDEAWMVLKQVHDTNMRAKGHPERVFSVSCHSPHSTPQTPTWTLLEVTHFLDVSDHTVVQ